MRELTVLLLVLDACGGGLTTGGSTGPSGGGGGERGSGPAADDASAWHAKVEAEARALDQHADVQRACGHDVQVVFDWPTYHQTDYQGSETPSACANDMLQGLSIRCTDKAANAGAIKIKSLTCHYKPCSEVRTTVPIESAGSTPTDEALAELKYQVSADGTNIDVSGCHAVQVFTETSAYQWLKQHL